jgi:hypothetical protein
MFRFPIRPFVAAVVVLSLTVLSVPAVHARPLQERTSPAHLEMSWFQAALSWLAGLVPGGNHGTTLQQVRGADISTTGLSGGARPNTGSCIDPLGGTPRCGGI